ncbi:MAG: rhamnulokinase [Treponema sp.]|jgi:rhamnulokinase|nr:rhamnulokinase [Treponema sp.]
MNYHYHLAVDIGASGGRHILGRLENGIIKTEEIFRFDNKPEIKNGILCWDIDKLLQNIIYGIKKCKTLGKIPATLGIDTWAVDFILLDKNDKILGEAVSYRDLRTLGMDKAAEKIIPYAELYQRTGIQKQIFNTIYQLLAVKQKQPELMGEAACLLMLPDYFNFRLTGVKKQEYTNATSTGLVNAAGFSWDFPVIEKLGLPAGLFGPLSSPGTRVGKLSADIAREAGFNCTVVLPCTHDTGSAYLAVPAEGHKTVYLSSGTWSLIGIETEGPLINQKSREANFTNEGGYDFRFRFLKNIMGLWIIQMIKRELHNAVSYNDLTRMAMNARNYTALIDINSPDFFSPPSMIDAVKKACIKGGNRAPENAGEILQCVYASLAVCYADVIREIQDITGEQYDRIHIVGGGCKDSYLNTLLAQAAGIPVFAGPVEGTAVGNLLAQMIGAGEFSSIGMARNIVKNSFEIHRY